MLELLTEGLGLAKVVAQYLVQKEGTKYVDQITALEKRVLETMSKWPNIDDAELASLLSEKRIIERALANQVQLAVASRS